MRAQASKLCSCGNHAYAGIGMSIGVWSPSIGASIAIYFLNQPFPKGLLSLSGIV